MKKILLYRNNYIGPEILGHLMVFEDMENGGSKLIFECKTIELEWKNNRQSVSCVPAGFYTVQYEWSPAFNQNLWELKGVPGRSEAKIHVANYYTDLRGCIAVGDLHIRINGDPYPDVRNSRNTLNRFHLAMTPDTEATIRIVGKA
jgi:hypothetical protein